MVALQLPSIAQETNMTSTGRFRGYACLLLVPLAASGCAGGGNSSNPPPFAATSPSGESDVAVAANVTAALTADLGLRAAVARGVAGVHSIHNELTLGASI
jgi:hypothetical protein